jgi:uncharacterized membrane protein YhaH (DUF805 family)
MQLLARVSWTKVVLVALAWPLVWLILGIVSAAIAVTNDQRDRPSGGLASVGFGITWLGALFMFGPSLALLVLRSLVGWR